MSGLFDSVMWNGNNSFQARCPCHDDRKASLTVSEADNGGIVLYCHAECKTKDVLDKLNLTWADISPEREKPSLRFDFHHVIASYEYSNGTRKLRDKNKNFFWQHKEADGTWKSKRGNAPHVLYKAGTTQHLVFVCEGEKDCNNVSKLGLFAVSSEHGAGSHGKKWFSEYTKEISGMDAVLLPDNDEVGSDFMQFIANEISGKCQSVKVLDLKAIWPDLPDKGDISDIIDHFAADQTKQLLFNQITVTPEWLPDANSKQIGTIQTKTFDDIDCFGEKGKFLFNVLGDYLIDKFHVCRINGVIHIYDNGLYRPGEELLYGWMLRLIPDLSDARRKETFKYLKYSLDVPEKTVSSPQLIPFKSRIYNISTDQFLEYTPEYVFLNRFPVDYVPEVPAVPLIDNTISAIATGDQAVIDLIYEAFGNCFYLLNAYRGTVMLYGPNGNNGKSTLLNLLLQMIGKDNSSFLTLQDMSERFRLIEIYGKALNICDDNSDQYVADSSVFKRVSTGGIVTAEKKGQDPIAFSPFCKAFFALNSLPPVSDKSKAFFSRLLLIPLNADFSSGEERNPNLKDRAWTARELTYLTRRSVEGLKRLIQNGDFTRPDSVKAELRRYEVDNNPVLGFLDEYDGTLIGKPTSEVYWDYSKWCDNNGHKTMSKSKFSREVCSQCHMKTEPRKITGSSGQTRCFFYDDSNDYT